MSGASLTAAAAAAASDADNNPPRIPNPGRAAALLPGPPLPPPPPLGPGGASEGGAAGGPAAAAPAAAPLRGGPGPGPVGPGASPAPALPGPPPFLPPGIVHRQPLVVDREKTCPLLLRVFPKHGGHHLLQEFTVRGQEPKGEVQIYTWKDATLRELTDLIREVSPPARRRDARLSFAFIYPNRQGRNVMKQVGITFSNTARRTMDEDKTLQELGFQTGDFLDVAIFS